MSVEKRKEAIKDIFQSGFLKGDIITKHIERQVLIDKYLPDSASFFFVVEPAIHKYHFVGKQQESVTGYTNNEALERGMEFFLECLHPDEVDILLKKIYPQIFTTLTDLGKTEDIRTAAIQFNYRFQSKNGKFINLLEQLYVLETDGEGNPALFLGHIVTLGNPEVLSLRLTIKVMKDNSALETLITRTYSSEESIVSTLTVREIDIMHHLATGKTSKQIGKLLNISNHTVDTHRRNLLKKLDCKSVVELTRIAFQNGIL